MEKEKCPSAGKSAVGPQEFIKYLQHGVILQSAGIQHRQQFPDIPGLTCSSGERMFPQLLIGGRKRYCLGQRQIMRLLTDWKFQVMDVKCAVHISLVIKISPGNPGKAIPLYRHPSGQFQHIFTADHILSPSISEKLLTFAVCSSCSPMIFSIQIMLYQRPNL